MSIIKIRIRNLGRGRHFQKNNAHAFMLFINYLLLTRSGFSAFIYNSVQYCIKYSLFNRQFRMIFTSAKSNASKFTIFPLYAYRSLRMPVAEVTPTPIAHEEPPCRGFEPTSNPPHAHQLARTPSGTLSRTLPFCPGPVSQAFLSTLWKISLKM